MELLRRQGLHVLQHHGLETRMKLEQGTVDGDCDLVVFHAIQQGCRADGDEFSGPLGHELAHVLND